MADETTETKETAIVIDGVDVSSMTAEQLEVVTKEQLDQAKQKLSELKREAADIETAISAYANAARKEWFAKWKARFVTFCGYADKVLKPASYALLVYIAYLIAKK